MANPEFSPLQGAFAHGAPCITGRIRAQHEDFEVEEHLGFTPDGEGAHLLLCVEKQGTNTEEVRRQIAKCAGLPARDIGYCGLKDRHARARQWFSVPLNARAEPDWSPLQSGAVAICARVRHRRKLRRGAHRANSFVIRIRDVQGERDDADIRLQVIKDAGVPNYFGPQRFGRQGRNVARGGALLSNKFETRNRHVRGLYVSAVRSALFNEVLSTRVCERNWNRLLNGDCIMLDGTRSVFVANRIDGELRSRAAASDIHPTGPLAGAGPRLVSGDAWMVEERVLKRFAEWGDGLARLGLRQERRALRIRARDLQWQWESAGTLVVRFCLDRGQYATSVLREFVALRP